MLAAQEGHIPRLQGLDGLRAIAVTAVVLYHAGLGWLPGGFLGVEVFFVISGYLITALLLAEWDARAHIDVGRFWLRRARRLLPALFALLAGVLVTALVWFPDEVARLRADAAAAAVYATNWYLVAGGQSYFETLDRPSALLHLWSLAIEEQFYVVWPLVLLAALRVAGRTGAVAVSLTGAVVSAVLMAALLDPVLDPSRLYYGTDTRLGGLLLGAALACLWVPDAFEARPRRAAGLLRDAAGMVAVAAIAAFFVVADDATSGLYRGGFLLLAAATTIAIWAVVHPWSRLGRLLDAEILRWIGTRSYGIYLWHWPVFTFARPGLELSVGTWPSIATCLVLTSVLAEASYRYVEMPVRRGELGRVFGANVPLRPGRALARPFIAIGALVVVSSVVVGAVATARPPAPPAYIAIGAVDGLVVADPIQSVPPSRAWATREPSVLGATPGPDTAGAPTTPSATSPPKSQPSAATPAPTPAPPSRATPRAQTPAPGRDPVLVVGDSVVIAVRADLARALGPITLDADVGRQTADLIAVLRQRRAAGRLAANVVVDIGNNGRITAEQFDAIMEALRNARRVVWVNLSVPRVWEGNNNRVIAAGVARHERARLADWHAASADRADLFWEDGYHPRPEGARLFAELVAAALR